MKEASSEDMTIYDAISQNFTAVERAWLEAAIAWEVCASIHERFAKTKDAFYSTRQADFKHHAEHCRNKAKA